MAAEADAAADLGRLFEGAPQFVERLLNGPPASSLAELLERAEQLALALPEAEQVALLNAHPRIGAAPASVSALSYAEQGYDRDPASAELQSRLDRLNDAYEQRFGFRFVVFVNGRSRSEMADMMEAHLDAGREEEKRRALSDVVAIARHRLANLGNETRQ